MARTVAAAAGTVRIVVVVVAVVEIVVFALVAGDGLAGECPRADCFQNGIEDGLAFGREEGPRICDKQVEGLSLLHLRAGVVVAGDVAAAAELVGIPSERELSGGFGEEGSGSRDGFEGGCDCDCPAG